MTESMFANVIEVVFRKPETVLKNVYGDDLEIIKFDTTNLVGTGENYGSTIMKVDVVIKHKNKEEKLNLVAKLFPPTEFQRQIFDSTFTFKKEIFFYNELTTAYKELLKKFKLDHIDYDVIPKFFGSRLSLNPNSDKVDEDAVILMDNLKNQGYYMVSRFDGLDLAQIKLAIKSLVKFHGIGLAIKKYNPNFVDKLKQYSKTLPSNDDNNFFDELKKVIVKRFEQLDDFKKYCKTIENILDNSFKNKFWKNDEFDKPFTCIIHADLWSNNMLFHDETESKRPDDVKFVDFQTYYNENPLKDLIFLITSSVNENIFINHFDELLEFYRIELNSLLNLLECNNLILSETEYSKMLKTVACQEFSHTTFMSRVITLKEGEKIDDFNLNDNYVKRLTTLLTIYDKQNWLND